MAEKTPPWHRGAKINYAIIVRVDYNCCHMKEL